VEAKLEGDLGSLSNINTNTESVGTGTVSGTQKTSSQNRGGTITLTESSQDQRDTFKEVDKDLNINLHQPPASYDQRHKTPPPKPAAVVQEKELEKEEQKIVVFNKHKPREKEIQILDQLQVQISANLEKSVERNTQSNVQNQFNHDFDLLEEEKIPNKPDDDADADIMAPRKTSIEGFHAELAAHKEKEDFFYKKKNLIIETNSEGEGEGGEQQTSDFQDLNPEDFKKMDENHLLDSASLSEMRLFLGSDKMKENSVRSLLQCISPKSSRSLRQALKDIGKDAIPPIESNAQDTDRSLGTDRSLEFFIQKIDNIEGSNRNKPIFQKSSFKDFTMKKFKQVVQDDNISQIIQMREKALKMHASTQKKYMNKMLKNVIYIEFINNVFIYRKSIRLKPISANERILKNG
jgi:hypothetical protein